MNKEELMEFLQNPNNFKLLSELHRKIHIYEAKIIMQNAKSTNNPGNEDIGLSDKVEIELIKSKSKFKEEKK